MPGTFPSSINTLIKEFEDIWSGSKSMLSPSSAASMPLTIDARETDTSYIMAVDLPGVKKENIDVDISGIS